MPEEQNRTTILKKNQLFIFALAAAAMIFSLVFFLQLSISFSLKLILAGYLALLPLFFVKPHLFVYFIFAITPIIRDMSSEEIIFKNDFVSINLSFIINLSILIFAAVLILRNFKQAKQIVRSRPIVVFAIFILFAGLSAFYSIGRQKTIEETLRLLAIISIAISSALVVKDKKTFYYLISSIIGGMIIPSLIGLKEFFLHEGWYDEALMANRPMATFSHPATFAFYLLFGLPILTALLNDKIGRAKKVFSILLISSFVVLIFMTMTRGAWVGLIIMILIFGIFKNRKTLAVAAIIGSLIYLSVPEINSRINDSFSPKYNSSMSTRLKIYTSTLPAFFSSPVLGNGFGSFEKIHLKYNEEAWTYYSLQAHNDYLRILIELGAIGELAYLAIFIFSFLYLYKIYQESSDDILKSYILSLFVMWTGALTISAGDNLLRTMPAQFLLWGYTAAVISFAINERGAEKRFNASRPRL